ncbi:hypothetical protein, partial [Methylophaga lonarensis]|uniref:hypothetical protein n=1 Tax=Methylophaga lonarensis TaxID=999151 RepID=UPI003D281FC8
VGLLIIVLFCMVALVASHQLTPIMTAIALAVLVFFQITKSRGLPLILALMTVVWMFFVARPFLNVYLPEIIHSIGTLSDNVGGNLINLDYASEGLIFVSKVGRIFTVSIIFMAMLGFLQRWRKGYVDLTAVLMISSSFLMLGLNSYGGEMLFRSLYFALPFLAFLIAGLFYSVRADADQWGQSFITISLVSVVCIMTFFYPYYGKENQYYVSPYEIKSIRYLQENAPQGSMISSIGPDWPITDVNYDDFYYFSFTERFEKVDREAMVEEPVERIYDILTRHDYSAAYVLITNSQRAFIETTGHYRPDSMDIILTALHEASEFEVVFENRDAIIFQAITDE